MNASRIKLLSMIILAIFMVSVSIALIPLISDAIVKNADVSVETAEATINRALIHCYAIEGAYPPSIYYLEDNYGVVLQSDRFYYYYEYIGKNIKPIVKVAEK